MGNGFYRSKDPTNKYQSTEGGSYKGKTRKCKQQNTHTYIIIDNKRIQV